MLPTELKPSFENIYTTYIENKIESRNDVHSFVRLLKQVETPCSIMLSGTWGSGKTFFVKQAQMILDALNPIAGISDEEKAQKVVETWNADIENNGFENEPFVTAYFDAWEHDDEDDPILSIVYELLNQGKGERIANKREICDIVSSLADSLLSTNLSGLFQNLRGKDNFDEIKEKTLFREQVKTFFASILPENGNKLVLFIDELDRCSPPYAIKLLERIKHYMLLDNIIFVISVNQVELQKTIQNLYGTGFESERYIDKFFQIRLGMPVFNMKKYLLLAGMSEYKNVRESVCFEMIERTNMSMREIAHYLHLSKAAAKKYTDVSYQRRTCYADQGASNDLAFCIIVPIMIGLMMTNQAEYQKFKDGRDSRWLEDIFEIDDLDGMASLLLDFSESYSETPDRKLVSKREKAKQLYDVVFVRKQDADFYRGVSIGSAIFRYGIRQRIMDAVNMFSQYTDFSDI